MDLFKSMGVVFVSGHALHAYILVDCQQNDLKYTLKENKDISEEYL